MPFGLAQRPAYFAALMQEELSSVSDLSFFHVHDVATHDSPEKDHLKYHKKIFAEFWEAGLKLKHSKCAFFREHLQNLGHLIPGEGIYSLSKKRLRL